MGRKAYVSDPMEREKGEMKKILWNWGQAMERFSWKEEVLKKLNKYYSMQKEIWMRDDSERAKAERKRLEREHKMRAEQIRIEMEEILEEKRQIDEWIGRLSQEEAALIYMRFQEGQSMDYIGAKLHLSRATVFRMQLRILKKMIDMKKEQKEK